MTDHSERDEAARDYSLSEGLVIFDGTTEPVVAHFIAGADWAVKNDPRVLKLVEACRFYANLENWHHQWVRVRVPDDMGLAFEERDEDTGSPVSRDCGDKMREALTEWSKP